MPPSQLSILAVNLMIVCMAGLNSCVLSCRASIRRVVPTLPRSKRSKQGVSAFTCPSISQDFALASHSKLSTLKTGWLKHSAPYRIKHQHKSFSTVQWASHFNVGDEVIIDYHDKDDNASYQSGRIEETRGGGWYTVCLSNDGIRVKRRGTQLQKKMEFDTDLLAKSGSESSTQLPSLPPVQIIDLDSILQHASQLSNNQNQDASETSEHESTLGGYIDKDTLEQIKTCHSKYNRWLIFSDLHVMPSTLSTCLQVLAFVHSTAMQHQAGILFLGDFWHIRGFIRVDCLCAVLGAMSNWQVPCIMIPGNHDQINWGGTEHALTPLKNAYRVYSDVKDVNERAKQYPGPLILSHPTKFMNALFVPHTRDKRTMQSILESAEAAESWALFVHADVKGASMNDLIKSQHGLAASVFPPGRCIYSGHFHKPHIVRTNGGSSIRYVGSPYQTSLSEAGQSKHLLLVDSQQGWACLDEISIDIGPRYHRVTSVSNLLNYDTELFVRSGDKLSVVMPQNELNEIRENATVSDLSAFDAKINQLRDAGVTVEIRNSHAEPMEVNTGDLEGNSEPLDFEEMTPRATLEAYINNELGNAVLGERIATRLLNDGLTILTELDKELGHEDVRVTSKKTSVMIELDSVSIAGFGSFRKEVSYPLSNRGVVLLRGTNKDFGSDSNGVGKTTLAMASLWALIGSVDPRPVQDGKVVDVVNDSSKVAEVTLRGSINKSPFLVKRTKNASTGSSLSFVLDGKDLTRQSPTDTQNIINEHFAYEPQLLTRSIFHGQHSIGSLLESSDAKFKDELSCLISLDVWQKSAALVRSKQRNTQRKLSELDGMIAIRLKDAERAGDKCRSAADEMNRRKAAIELERKALIEQEKAMSDLKRPDIDEAINELQTKLQRTDAEINQLENELYSVTAANNEALALLRAQLDKSVPTQAKADSAHQQSIRHLDAKETELKTLERKLASFKLDCEMSDSNDSLAAANKTCRTCGQQIISAESRDFFRRSSNEKIDALAYQIQQARDEVRAAETSKSKAEEDSKAIHDEVNGYRNLLQKEDEVLALCTQDLRSKLKSARKLQATRSSEYSGLMKQSQEISQALLAKSDIVSEMNRLDDALMSSKSFHETCLADLELIEANIANITKDKEALENQASSYSSLVDIFGSKGIQAFVLRNMVKALQHYSKAYLDELSDGSLELALDIGSNDNIMKFAKVQNPDGTWRKRSLSSLSGGQWRRCSLALSLGFIELASHRGKLRSSLLVLDEPLTHLDSAGRSSVGKLLRKMLSNSDESTSTSRLSSLGLSTILVILQDIAAEEIEECFDYIDEVVKSDGESYVVLQTDYITS